MDFSQEYKQKLISAKDAAAMVQSGDWLDYGWCNATAYDFDKELAKRVDELKDVKIRGGVLMWQPEISKVDPKGEHFTWNSWHCSGIERKTVAGGVLRRALYCCLTACWTQMKIPDFKCP